MPVITNKTNKPLSISLPGGKRLHLGPGKTGQVAPSAATAGSIKKLIEAGEIEFSQDDSQRSGGTGASRDGP